FKVNIYIADTKEKLDMSLCDKEKFEMKVPLKDSGIDLDLYNEYMEEGIDITNPNDPAFTSICYQYISKANDYDTTRNSRATNLYQNKTIQCSTGCEYGGLDQYGYVRCDCHGASAADAVVSLIADSTINQFSNVNIGIVTCFIEVFSVNKIINC